MQRSHIESFGRPFRRLVAAAVALVLATTHGEAGCAEVDRDYTIPMLDLDDADAVHVVVARDLDRRGAAEVDRPGVPFISG